MATIEELESRLHSAHVRIEVQHRRAAAANRENEALRREVRSLRHAKFVLENSDHNSINGGYRVRYEKLSEAILMIRELATPEVTGIPYALPKSLEPFVTEGRATS